MKIAEMQAWLLKVEPGPTNCAVRMSFELCLQDPATANTLAVLIAPLKEADYTAYLLSLGHFIAFASLNKILESNQEGVAAVERRSVQ